MGEHLSKADTLSGNRWYPLWKGATVVKCNDLENMEFPN